MVNTNCTYHHITLHSSGICEQWIVNCPLTVNEMYNFIKNRLTNYTTHVDVTFSDTITDNPGCPNVISLNTLNRKLAGINGNEVKSLTKKL